MHDCSVNNKRIAKNALALYLRMLLTMGIALYTSRVVLSALGIEDYGIYNVTGGLVTMFTFLNGAMNSSTQRYLNYALGKHDFIKAKKVFNTAVQIHVLFSIVIIVLSETVGLWFILNKLVIPENRLMSALWVYQCSILTAVISFISVPYNASIVAHEKMSAFAYISIAEAFAKFIIALLITVSHCDKLKLYAVLLLLMTFAVRFLYRRYCKVHFEECQIMRRIDKPLFREMSNFAGWSFAGNLSGVFYTHGLNILLNIFFGPTVNAARGIASQVQGMTRQFLSSFQTALNPQITKYYAENELDQMKLLVCRSAKFSYYLLFLLTLPVLLETDTLLILWQRTVPEETVIFVQLMIVVTLEYSIANSCMVANQATGKVKKFQLIEGGILLLIVPISYMVLRLGAPPFSVFLIHIVIEFFAQLARIVLIKEGISLPIQDYIKKVYCPIFFVTITSSIIPIIIHYMIHQSFVRLFLTCVICLICTIISICVLGLDISERKFVSNRMKFFFSKCHKLSE